MANQLHEENSVNDNAPARSAATRPSDAGRTVPLSFGQQRIWFVEKMLPGREALIVPSVWRINGPLDAGKLQEALQSIVARHETLRTRFPDASKPIGEVIDFAPRLEVIDLSAAPTDSLQSRVHEAVRELLTRPFPFVSEPPIRTWLIRESADRHILVTCIHHIACDAWGRAVYHHELAQSYNALVRGNALPDPPRVQIPAYAAWQQEQEITWDEGLNYWKDAMADAEPFVIPTDFPRPDVPSGRFGVASVRLPKTTTELLVAYARDERVTTYMLLLAAFFALMHRQTGRNDIVVGSPMAERSRPELEWLIGFLLNNLPMRAKVFASTTFSELSRSVRTTVLNAFAHHEVPYERIVGVARQSQSGSSAPLFNVLFNMHANLRDPDIELDGVSCERYPLTHSGANFDCTLYVHDEDDTLRCDLVFDADLYKHEHIQSIANQYEALLTALLQDPHRQIGSIELASRDVYSERLGANLPPSSEPGSSSRSARIDEQIYAQHLATPNAVAVASESLSLTYAQLWNRATLVGNQLSAAGVKSGDVVGLLATRGVEVPVGMLGILAADATILLLDASDPVERNELLLSRAGATFLLPCAKLDPISGFTTANAKTTAATKALATAPGGPPEERTGDAFDADALAGLTVVQDVSTVVSMIHPDGPRDSAIREYDFDVANTFRETEVNLKARHNTVAYVSFTSGTTGEPRKVTGSHATLTATLDWRAKTFGFGPIDRNAFVSSLTSDACFRDTLIALAFGATVCVPDRNQFLHPNYLASWMRRQKCTVANMTPALIPLLFGDPSIKLSDLRIAFVVGDVLKRIHVEAVRKAAPNARVINYYGTTETGQSLAWFDTQSDSGAGTYVPLGTGEFETIVAVRSEAGLSCAPYERGEIVVCSNYLANFSKRNSQTKTEPADEPQAFAPSSGDGYNIAIQAQADSNGSTVRNRDLTHRPGEYWTGDYGYHDEAGTLHYIGRIDRQATIRGYRVNLPEVEGLLRGLSEVNDVIVTDALINAEHRLLAHVRASTKVILDSGELVRKIQVAARRILPSYMIPFGYVLHKTSWPTNRNGKPDFKKLGEASRWDILQTTGAAHSNEALPAIAEISREERATLDRICNAFKDVLNTTVGPTDDFFSLGGHSLLAVELFGRLSAEIGLELPLSILFSDPTPLGILNYTRTTSIRSADTARLDAVVPIRSGGLFPPLFIVHGAGGQVLKFDKLSRHLESGRPLYGLQAKGVDGVSAPHETIQAMADEYVDAIRRTSSSGIVHLAGYSGGGVVALEVARQLTAEGRLGRLVLLDTYCPFPAVKPDESPLSRRRQHLDELRRVGPGYLLTWMKKRVRFERFRQKRRRYADAKQSGALIPHDLREVGLLDAFRAALKRHSMQPVDFPVVLIASEEERVAHSEWNRWMKNGLETHTVKGSHDDFILEPSVQQVAKLLDSAMTAQEN